MIIDEGGVSQVAEIIQALAPLGIGGVLAGFIFYFYRLDRTESRDSYKAMAESFRSIVQDNTKAVTELTTLLRNGGSLK